MPNYIPTHGVNQDRRERKLIDAVIKAIKKVQGGQGSGGGLDMGALTLNPTPLHKIDAKNIKIHRIELRKRAVIL